MMRSYTRAAMTAFLLGAAALPAVAHAAPAGVAELLQQADFWRARGRPDLADQALRRILAIDPGNSEARQRLAPAKPAAAKHVTAADKSAQNESRAAAAKDKTAVSRSNKGGKARAAGFEALNTGALEHAASLFGQALKANPADDDATGGLGVVRLRQKRFGEAKDLLEKASKGGSAAKWASALQAAEQAVIRQQTRSIRAEAIQQLASGDVIGTERTYQAALANNPDDPWLRYDYARFLAGQRRMPAADAVLAPLRTSNNAEDIYAAALFANQTGRDQDARTLVSHIAVSQRTPAMNAFAVQLKTAADIAQARRLQKSGRTDEAVTMLRDIARTPDLPPASLGELADALYNAGDSATALAIAREAAAMPIAEPEAYEGIVAVLARGGDDAAAASLVRQVADKAAQSGSSLQSVGRLNATLAANQADRLRLSGDLAAAFDTLQSAWATAPNDTGILNALARLYQTGGMSREAMQVYDMVLHETPEDTAALAGMADAAAASGDFDRARNAISTLMRVSPGDPDTYMAAARVEQARGDKRTALKYLRQARALYDQQMAMTNPGGFPSTNPFAQRVPSAMNGAINPFALGRNGARMPMPDKPVYAPRARRETDRAVPSPAYLAAGAPASAMGPMASSSAAIPARAAPYGDTTAAQPYAADPARAKIGSEIASLTENTGPQAQVSTNIRQRSGEKGLSRLDEIGGTASLSTGFADGRVGVKVSPTVIDAGAADAAGLSRFGGNPVLQAAGVAAKATPTLAPVDAQHDAGVAVAAYYEGDSLQADVGSTPIGFDKTRVQGGITWSPKPSRKTKAKIWAEHRPVTDSVTAYAGARDPVTTLRWGAVMKTGGGVSFSYDNGNAGVYADASAYHYDGVNVRDNRSMQVNVGGYVRAYRTASSTITAGANLNYQAYRNNQNFFSLGHGGYFSPQSFISLGFPISYEGKFDGWKLELSASPGYQSYQQDAEAIFPTQPGLQALLNSFKYTNPDVLARYSALSKSGFGIAAGAAASYQLGGGMNLGGDVRLNTFGAYNELQMMLRLTQSLGGSGQ